tara:strand:- start:222 stop:482 length:261 start_codon:yes stop_codon:yes gene_type:complete
MEQEISSIQLVLTIPLLVFLGCAIVAMFQQGKTGLGITTIILIFACGIGSFIAFAWGWMSNNVNIKIMIAWTLTIIANVIAGVVGI